MEETAGAQGRIDIVDNNASAARFAPIQDLTDEDGHFTIRNELDLVFYVTRYAWPHLVAAGGSVIITASAAGLGGSTTTPMVAHAATKGAVIAMTRQRIGNSRAAERPAPSVLLVSATSPSSTGARSSSS